MLADCTHPLLVLQAQVTGLGLSKDDARLFLDMVNAMRCGVQAPALFSLTWLVCECLTLLLVVNGRMCSPPWYDVVLSVYICLSISLSIYVGICRVSSLCLSALSALYLSLYLSVSLSVVCVFLSYMTVAVCLSVSLCLWWWLVVVGRWWLLVGGWCLVLRWWWLMVGGCWC